MPNERKRILTMLENGTISTDEALTLLENLSTAGSTATPASSSTPVPSTSDQTTQQSEPSSSFEEKATEEPDTEDSSTEEKSSKHGWSSSSADEFMEDLRKDLTTVGDQFMQFMQGAVQKVKDFDMDNPFGTAATFEHSAQVSADDITELVIDIDNGKVSIAPGDSNEISAVFSVKTFTSNSDEDAKQEFLEKLIFKADGQTLRISNNSKTVQVNTVLTVPQKAYDKISVRLLNGGLDVRNLESDTVRVKTANGKVNMSYMKTDTAEMETLNGEIRLLSFEGSKLDTQTLNGQIYIDGKLKHTEARTLNGPITVTTTHEAPEKIRVKSVGGNIELYVPNRHSLVGDVTSTIGSLSVKLPDVDKTSNQDQLLHRQINFKKEVSDSPAILHLSAESKTSSVLVCYTPNKDV